MLIGRIISLIEVKWI